MIREYTNKFCLCTYSISINTYLARLDWIFLTFFRADFKGIINEAESTTVF